MRFMIIVKPTLESGAEITPVPDEALLTEMVDYHEAPATVGMLVDRSGLRASRDGWRSRVDGPFAETGERVAGCTIIDARPRQEAIDRFRELERETGAARAS